ncbi:hypothetical protein U9M48_012231, partial [Paspalum notatum var. saurae]
MQGGVHHPAWPRAPARSRAPGLPRPGPARCPARDPRTSAVALTQSPSPQCPPRCHPTHPPCTRRCAGSSSPSPSPTDASSPPRQHPPPRLPLHHRRRPPLQGLDVHLHHWRFLLHHRRVVLRITPGGPTKGTRFRPLSLNVPKPLFALAGQPMAHHPISACRRIPNLAQIYLIGFYEEQEFALYVSSISNELRIPVRYLREDKPHGSAGGLYSFRDYIMEDSTSHIVLLNCDVCSSFPLPDML